MRCPGGMRHARKLQSAAASLLEAAARAGGASSSPGGSRAVTASCSTAFESAPSCSLASMSAPLQWHTQRISPSAYAAAGTCSLGSIGWRCVATAAALPRSLSHGKSMQPGFLQHSLHGWQPAAQHGCSGTCRLFSAASSPENGASHINNPRGSAQDQQSAPATPQQGRKGPMEPAAAR